MSEVKRGNSLVIWILGALATVTPIAIDLYLPAFSQIADDFKTTPATISLSVSSYFIGMAIGQILYGPLLDRFGRKNPLYAGLLIFIAASLGCMEAWNVETLVVFRFMQALGGSAAWVAALAMVRDFFPIEQSARVFSLLILILGVSPLLAPTIGGYLTVAWGWHSVFIVLAVVTALILIGVVIYLPEGHQPDPKVSLKPKPILLTFLNVLKNRQFHTYTFSGAFAFATLFIYVAGSPVIFMEIFHVSPQQYGMIFAFLSIGLIGGSQLNIFLTRKFKSERIFFVALTCQVTASLFFLVGVWGDFIGLYASIGMFFILLSCLGLINPNANALALAPFTNNIGSASALLGFTQIGVAAMASTGVGLLSADDTTPIVSLIATTASVALVILLVGKSRISRPTAATDGVGSSVLH